jgi:hypothetical protein
MSDKEETVVLPNGTRKTFPAGTSDEYIDNWTERAHNRIESQNKDWADRSPADFARVMAGRGSLIGNVTDYLKETKPRYPANMPLVGGLDVAPDVIGRGVISRNPVVGLGDLATAAYNIPAKTLNEGLPSEQAPPGTTFEGTIPVPFEGTGPRANPLPLLTPPSAALGELAGVKPQGPDAGYPERFLEAIISIAKNPAAGVPIPRAFRPQAPGTALPQPVITPHGAPGSANIADSSVPYAARVDRPGDLIDQTMTQVAPEARRLAANPVAGAVGRGASAAGSVLGGDLGEYLGGDVGALLGSLAGGMAPNVTSTLLRAPVREHYARPGDESEHALRIQEEAGVSPTPGTVGNARVAMAQSTAARVPLPLNPAARRQERTLRDYENASMEELNRIYPQGETIQTPDVTGAQMQNASRQGTANLDDYFRRGYEIVDQGVPPETLVRPQQTYQTAGDMAGPTSSESAATNRVIGQALEANVEPSVVQRERLVQPPPVPAPGQPQFGPLNDQPPVQVTETGLPYPKARPTGTDLFHSQERQNPSAAGAIGILRRAFAGDTADALMNDPFMQQAFPNPADRQAKAERLQVLAREYSQQMSPTADTTLPPTARAGQGGPTGHDITQQDPGSEAPGTIVYPFGGGSYPVLEQIEGAQTANTAYEIGKNPDRMAVLQRNAQDQYPPIARNVVGQQWSGASGDIDPLAVARTWGPGRRGLGENQKGILTNDDPEIVHRGTRLAQIGDLLREQIAADRNSRTMPMMATAALPMTVAASPGLGIPAGIAAYAANIGVSGDTLMRYLARTRPQMFELMARKGSDAALMAAGQMADDQARAMREGTGFIEEGARLYDQATGMAGQIPRGAFFTPLGAYDAMRGR